MANVILDIVKQTGFLTADDLRNKCYECRHYESLVKKARGNRLIDTMFARGACVINGNRVYKQRTESCKKFIRAGEKEDIK